MKRIISTIFCAALLLGSAVGASAKGAPKLPGKTFKNQVTAGQKPEINPNHAFGVAVSPCPFTPMSLADLTAYARVNYPNVYRQALGLRRGGFTQEQTRLFLVSTLCALEGY